MKHLLLTACFMCVSLTVPTYAQQWNGDSTDTTTIHRFGKVGLGTPAPANLLHLYGTDNYLRFSDTDATTGARIGLNGYELFIDNQEASAIVFRANNAEAMRIDAAQNVGIGTTSPAQTLDVDGQAVFGNTATRLTTYSDPVYSGIYNGTSIISDESFYMGGGALFFFGNGNERMRITSSGNVGIGTTSPNTALEVRGNSSTYSDFEGYSGLTNGIFPNGKKASLIIHENISGSLIPSVGGQATYRGGLSFGHGGPGLYSVNDNPAGSPYYGDLRFHTTSWNGSDYDNADRMIITRGGNVGIGTISPGHKLDVAGTLNATEILLDGQSIADMASVWDETESKLTYTDGNVGIGTTFPTTTLEVRGNSSTYSDFAGYTGSTDGVLPNGKKASLIIHENIAGSYTPGVADQATYRGGLSFGHGGPGVYSVNPNPAGSAYYGDLRFQTTSWNGSNLINMDRMVITYIGNVGIGTTTPAANLDIEQAGPTTLRVAGTAGNSSYRARLLLDRGDDFRGAGMWITASTGNEADWYAGVPYTGNGFTIGNHSQQPEYRQHSKFYINPNGNIGIGTANPSSKLAVDGTITSKEVVVTVDQAAWPDYVFEDDYDLRSLAEVETFIEQNGHLPDVPSAEEVGERGVAIGDMQTTLLKKIEELTLYLLDQQRINDEHRVRMDSLAQENAYLRTRLTQLDVN